MDSLPLPLAPVRDPLCFRVRVRLYSAAEHPYVLSTLRRDKLRTTPLCRGAVFANEIYVAGKLYTATGRYRIEIDHSLKLSL